MGRLAKLSIMVTGGTGLLGSHIVKGLVQQGESPIVFDISPQRDLLGDALSKARVVTGDILNLAELIETMKRGDVKTAVHTAALLTTVCEARPMEAVKVNLEGTVNVLEASRLTGVERVVFTSSSAVYGNTPPDAVLHEDYHCMPSSIYGITKLAGEEFGKRYSANYGLEFLALRLGGVLYGPGPMRSKATIVIREILEKGTKGLPVRLPVDSETEYRFLYVRDASDAHLAACRAPKTKHQVFNVNALDITLKEIVETARTLLPGVSISVGSDVEGDRRLYTQTYRQGLLNSKRAKDELGIEPHYMISQGLRETAEWYRGRLK